MKKVFQNISAIVVLLAIAIIATSFKSDIGKVIPDFDLRNVDGKMISTSDYKNAKGFIVIFTCNHCPFAKLYSKRMNDLNKKYSALNIPLIAINSMDTLIYAEESFSKMKLKAKSESFNFPYLQDALQTAGKNFGAEHTPTAYVIWKENNQWKIKYKGSIDDNGENPQIAKPFVANAVDELLNEQPVTNSETQSFGCAIIYRK
ncbi:MAG: thioredoxin family protein [Bacteroidota bacterium]